MLFRRSSQEQIFSCLILT
ncbi:hypothetical protein LINPERPRIM_LOCUS5229 [Linum perenne]